MTDGNATEKSSRVVPRDVWARLSDEEVSDGYLVLIDNPSRDFFHPVSDAEIRATLDRLPNRLTEYLRAVVLPRMSVTDQVRGVEARRRNCCIVLNPFPKDCRIFWTTDPPSARVIKHYEPWGAGWEEMGTGWFQVWTLERLKNYYLFHLLLHELGHINQPCCHSLRRRESFAEDFALTWAFKLGALTKAKSVDATAGSPIVRPASSPPTHNL